MADKAQMTPWGCKKRLFVYSWQGPDAVQSFAPLAGQPYALFLNSNRAGHALSRYSYILWQPFETIESKDGVVRVCNADSHVSYRAEAFQVVRERLALWAEDAAAPRGDLPPFQGGACGFFGYDLARGLERLPAKAEAHEQPDMAIGLYDKVIAFDHDSGRAHLMIHAADEETALVHKAYIERVVTAGIAPRLHEAAIEWQMARSNAAYIGDIKTVIDYIYAGDIFQANLSRRFSADVPAGFDTFGHYMQLRDINPAPYAAYMNFGGGFVLSGSSPERFLSTQGRKVETRPIKGTMPDTMPPSALAESEKDRAENIMIVDLLRNDLSKVCEDHSIQVTALCDIETFEGLHHMVSHVGGTLRADMGAVDALRACFPGGSVTGAPKIRAMEIIDELEPQRRGAYCGAIGYIGFDGTMDTAITIRTLVYDGGRVHLQTGGGITALSEAQAELEETIVKADKIFTSFSRPSLREGDPDEAIRTSSGLLRHARNDVRGNS